MESNCKKSTSPSKSTYGNMAMLKNSLEWVYCQKIIHQYAGPATNKQISQISFKYGTCLQKPNQTISFRRPIRKAKKTNHRIPIAITYIPAMIRVIFCVSLGVILVLKSRMNSWPAWAPAGVNSRDSRNGIVKRSLWSGYRIQVGGRV